MRYPRILLQNIAILFALLPSQSQAEVEYRLLAQEWNTNPTKVSSWLEEYDLPELSPLKGWAVEVANFSDSRWGWGLRVGHANMFKEDQSGDYSLLSSTYLAPLLRYYPFRSSYFNFDVFAGGGLSFGTFEANSGGRRSTYRSRTSIIWDVQKNEEDDGYKLGGLKVSSNNIALVGASISFGFKDLNILIEGGYQWNKLDKIRAKRNPQGSLKEIDLGGAFTSLGLIYGESASGGKKGKEDQSFFGPQEIRVIANVHSVNLEQGNAYFEGQGLETFSHIQGITIDGGSAKFGPNFNVRFSYAGAYSDSGSGEGLELSTVSTVKQAVLLRFINNTMSPFGYDLYGGAGVSWATLRSRKNGVNSTYEPLGKDVEIFTLAGATLSWDIGPTRILCEFGQEWNRIWDLTFQRNPQGTLNSIDLSGPYLGLGVAFKF